MIHLFLLIEEKNDFFLSMQLQWLSRSPWNKYQENIQPLVKSLKGKDDFDDLERVTSFSVFKDLFPRQGKLSS